MLLQKKYIGRIELPTGTVDVTAPFHKTGSNYRHVLAVAPGQYDCYIFEGKAENDWRTRTWIAQIVIDEPRLSAIVEKKLSTGRSWKKITAVGVSDGLTGFFDRKPEFSDAEMEALYHMAANRSGFVYDRDSHPADAERPLYNWRQDAFLVHNSSTSGEAFQVYAVKHRDVCVALEIRLLSPWR